MALVKGKDREDLKGKTAAAVLGVQTVDARLEIDWYNSFLPVDSKFLEGIEERWWM